MMTPSLSQREQDVDVPAQSECHQHSCRSRVPHPGIPGWLNPETVDWHKLVRRVGRQEALNRRQVYLQGFTDTRGNHWCGQCYWRFLLLERGEQLAYLALPLVHLPAGYGAWMVFAQEVSFAAVEDAVRAAERLCMQEVRL